MNSYAVWYLADPRNPCLVGRVRLDGTHRRCVLDLDDRWRASGFALSPDLTLDRASHASLGDLLAPGALDDAMPDRWGERMIRFLSRPTKMSPLDKLWYAGDRRFGALGLSSSTTQYLPIEELPLLEVDSLPEAKEVIARVLAREPINQRERQLIFSGNSLGGAHPKILLQHEGAQWIAKFPRGNNVDQLLIEHACMELARRAGIDVAESMVIKGDVDHVLMVRRFDRQDEARIHAVSARTMLVREGDDSYASMAGIIRKHAAPQLVVGMQRELFRRMAFNIMIDNTDDHTKNHSFLRSEDGYWRLSPAYDIPTQMNGLGLQAIQISPDPDNYNDFGVKHAQAAARLFGMTPQDAVQAWNEVAGWVAKWRIVFADCGVTETDIDYLADFLDAEPMLDHRKDAIEPTSSNHTC